MPFIHMEIDNTHLTEPTHYKGKQYKSANE